MNAYMSDLHWQSDWSGYEVGYPELNVVGLYTSATLDVDVYINAETGEVIEIIGMGDE